jgi:pyruvate/2-oxoglutarate dehydrogenase complex dihydrolipoamide dehydrogenase (E3) component
LARRYSEMGVDLFLGEARFTNPHTVSVDGKTLRFRKAVIAAGARAVHPDIPGLAETGYLTNETVFNLTRLPQRLAVVGGGPIGCELAQAFRRFGAEVTIIETARFLPREDSDASALLARVFEREGLRVMLETQLIRVEKGASGKRLIVRDARGEQSLEVDEILVGVGRRPNVEGLDLEKAGVAYDARQGVRVDDFLRTGNPDVFAAGDICMAWKFTHAADASARIAVQNALFRGKKRLSRLTMPWCTYTDPEIAHVGLYESEARSRHIAVDSYKVDLGEVDRAVVDGQNDGFIKIIVKKGSDRILGATVVASHAGSLISEISLAMAAKAGLKTIGSVIHPYPTQAEAIKRAADLYNRTRLTPFVKNLLTWWLNRQRR